MINQKLHVGVLIRKIFSEEGTGSFTFVNSFLQLPTVLKSTCEVSLIFDSNEEIKKFRKLHKNNNAQCLNLDAFNPNCGNDQLTFIESIRFRFGSWMQKLFKFFFLESNLSHPRLVADFEHLNKLQTEILIDENKIDLMFYPFWFDYPTTDRPFVLFYWDAAHRYYHFLPEYGPRDVEKAFRLSLEKAFKVIVPNEAAVTELNSLYSLGDPNHKFHEIPFSFPTIAAAFSKSKVNALLSKLGINKSYLFIPAGFWPHKNHTVLVDAISELKKRGTFIDVVMTGPDRGNYDYVRSRCKTLDVSAQFHYLGFVKKEELQVLYQEAEAMVFPSITGPNNYPPIEATSHGCPVILSDLPGHRQQMGEAAIYFNKFDPIDLALKIENILTNPRQKNTLIKKGFELIKELHPDSYFNSLSAIIKEYGCYRRLWGDKFKLK